MTGGGPFADSRPKRTNQVPTAAATSPAPAMTSPTTSLSFAEFTVDGSHAWAGAQVEAIVDRSFRPVSQKNDASPTQDAPTPKSAMGNTSDRRTGGSTGASDRVDRCGGGRRESDRHDAVLLGLPDEHSLLDRRAAVALETESVRSRIN